VLICAAYTALRGTASEALLAIAPLQARRVPAVLPFAPTSATPMLIKDRALFHSSRHFFVPPEPSTRPPPPAPPAYQLVGTLVIPKKPTVALLKASSSDIQRRISVGDNLDGWLVDAVEMKRVTLHFEDQHTQIGRDALHETHLPATTPGLTRVPLVRVHNPGPTKALRVLGSAASGPATAPGEHSIAARSYRPPRHESP
jgi:hypothetical protein